MRQKDGTWRQVTAETVLEKAGTQPLGTYIDRIQAKVAEWVALRPILEVFNIATGFGGVGRCREPWWKKTSARMQLSATLKYILSTAKERRWKSGRRGERIEVDREAEDSEDGAGSDESWYSGTETGDVQVGE